MNRNEDRPPAQMPEPGPEPDSQKFVTSVEVARLAGVSRSAVSRTFTPGASVSDETRRRVNDAASKLGYRVNRLAQSLIGESSNMVGIVGANLAAPFMSAQLDALSRALLKRGLQTLLLNASETDDFEKLISLMLEFRVRAIVVMSGRPPARIVDECIRNNVRVVLINTVADIDTDRVLVDDALGAKLAAERLLQTKCRSFVVINGRPNTYNHTLRASKFLEHVASHGRPVRLWEADASDYGAGQAAAAQIIAEREFDAVFCTTDLTAIGVIDGLRARLSKRVPEDVSVIGFDDISQAGWDAYQLTTIRQPVEIIAARTIEALERADGMTRHLTQIVPVSLVERNSVKND